MGLIEEKKGNKTFLKVVNGKLTQALKEKTETSIERTNSENKIVHENRFGGLQGWICGITLDEEGSFGTQLKIDVTEKGENYQIQIPLKSGFAYDFLSRVEGVDFSKHVVLNTYKIPREDNKEKFNYVFTIKQEGVKVAKRYTKEFPNGLPQASEKKVGKKTEWDFTEITNFYYKIAESVSKKVAAIKNEIVLNSQE
jgi:hypothetical protein